MLGLPAGIKRTAAPNLGRLRAAISSQETLPLCKDRSRTGRGRDKEQGTPGKRARTMGPEVSEKPLRVLAAARRFSGRLRDAQAEAPLRACRISHRWATASSGLDPAAPRPRCRAIHFCSSLSCSKVKRFGSHASMRAERVGSPLLPPFALRASGNPASCNCFANSFAIINPSPS